MKSLVYKITFHSLVLVLISSCNLKNNKDACIDSEKVLGRKVQLENEIREQVKFIGESEKFNSITNKMSEYHIPALSLAIIHQGKIEWADLYKNVNFPEVHQLDCSSIFQAASLSKPVSFLAALRMHSAGEIDLDKNIQEYLKDFVIPVGKQSIENPVTFRNIFSHTSGINPGGYKGYVRDLVMPTDLDILRGNEGVNTPAIEVSNPPNELLAYSGGAYTLAELALQDIYQEEFADIMKKWILNPLEMNHSEFTQPLPVSDSNRVAKAYNHLGKPIEGGWRNHPEQAAAGLWSNSIDLAKFMIEMHKAYKGESSIFSKSDIQNILEHERHGQAFGFIINRSKDDIAITHFGGNVGYRTGMTISLTSGNGLVYLTNSDNGGSLGNELLLSASQVYDWKHFKQTEVQREQVNAEVLEDLSGKYKWNNQIDLSIKFDQNTKRISLYFPNGDMYTLNSIVGDKDHLEFIHPNTGVKASFSLKDNFQSFSLYGQTAVKLELDTIQK
ncbi:serine hydrolase domain-containing protein [Marinifilum flexuosum]|uniref:serine hydrolase domain-containing protein n=1 Tax=Marinifilum flexuosum TaxID=1117708 RepID=UPI0024957557|nr:serine hydrolase domain-containing protein [Marinifilum flexuosum]